MIFGGSCSRNTSETTHRDVNVVKHFVDNQQFPVFSLTLRETLPCLFPVRRLPTQSRARHFGGVSAEKKTHSDNVTRNALAGRNNGA